jgi:hypothetical protein
METAAKYGIIHDREKELCVVKCIKDFNTFS